MSCASGRTRARRPSTVGKHALAAVLEHYWKPASARTYALRRSRSPAPWHRSCPLFFLFRVTRIDIPAGDGTDAQISPHLSANKCEN